MLHLSRTLLPIWLAAASALIASACGGNSSDNSGTGTAGGSTGTSGSSSSGGTAAAGSAAVAGTSSTGGSTGTGGSSASGGSTSSGGSGGVAGSAGSGGRAACEALISAAYQALAAAQACNPTLNVEQCTGSVRGICGCTVATQPNDSAATKAYLAALMAVQSKQCVQPCPAIACIAPGPGSCLEQAGSSMGTCTSGRLPAQ